MVCVNCLQSLSSSHFVPAGSAAIALDFASTASISCPVKALVTIPAPTRLATLSERRDDPKAPARGATLGIGISGPRGTFSRHPSSAVAGLARADGIEGEIQDLATRETREVCEDVDPSLRVRRDRCRHVLATIHRLSNACSSHGRLLSGSAPTHAEGSLRP